MIAYLRRNPVLVTMLSIVLIVLAASVLSSQLRAAPQLAQQQQLVYLPLVTGRPPQLAFRSFNSSKRMFGSVGLDGASPAISPKTLACEHASIWSTRGTHVACEEIFCGKTSCSSGLFNVMSLDGTTEFSISDGYSRPEWSPDGSQIAFDDQGVEVIRTDGTGRQTVSDESGRIEFGSVWSPDGTALAYISRSDSSTDGPFQIAVVSADGSTPRKLMYEDIAISAIGEIAWSPDGKQLAYTASGGLVVLNIDGTGQRFIGFSGTLPGLRVSRELRWSPDGIHIVTGFSYRTDIGLLLARADGTELKYIAWGSISRFEWSSNGDLAYQSFYDTTSSVTVLDANGREKASFAAQSFSWSPDGQLIALITSTANTSRVLVAAPDGTMTRTVLEPVLWDEVVWMR